MQNDLLPRGTPVRLIVSERAGTIVGHVTIEDLGPQGNRARTKYVIKLDERYCFWGAIESGGPEGDQSIFVTTMVVDPDNIEQIV